MSSSPISLQFLILLLLAFTVLSCVVSTATKDKNCQKTWCVAKPSSDESALYNNIQFACSVLDCSVIQSGGACFYPDTNVSHASVAMNLYYQANGRNPWNCYFSFSGLTVVTDPSYGDCKYA